MKRLLLVLAACGSSKHASPPAEAAVPRDAAIDAVPCPGKADDCAACGSGNGSACFHVALAVSSDPEKGPWYERGCEHGDIESCQGTWWFYTFVHRSDAEADRASAREHQLEAARTEAARKACDAHDEKACEEAGEWIMLGMGAAKDQAAGLAILDASCGRGDLESCEAIVVASDDAAVRMKYAKRACHSGRADTCGELLGVWGASNAPHAPAFARAELQRMCRAKQADACGVLEEERHPTQLPGMDDAKLDLGPLIDATKSGTPHRP